MNEKNIFVPLKTEHYEKFEDGTKKHEYRAYGPRWNERTCVVGRGITLSKGYGKQNRLYRTIVSFEKVARKNMGFREQMAFLSCYGEDFEYVAEIGVSDA